MTMDPEVQGDFSNLKGSLYHLRFALRELLTGESERVWFYRGNDLLAHPVAPPLVDEGAALPMVTLAQQTSERDTWVQLKFTEKHWTPSDLLTGNLLMNFICNAVRSEKEGRPWGTRLVTPARVDQDNSLEAFIAYPEGNQLLLKKLNAAIDSAQAKLLTEGFDTEATSREKLHDHALNCLIQLRQSEPVRHETLVAEIEREIAFDYPDAETVRAIANSLLGAMLSQAGAGPDKAVTYDTDWLVAASDRDIGKRTQISRDLVATCNESVSVSLPSSWNKSRFVRRIDFESAFAQFQKSSKTAFVLLGNTGTGKSWVLADLLERVLHNQPRMLLSGSDLFGRPSLDSLVAQKLRGFGPANWPEPLFVRRLASGPSVEAYSAIVAVDDLEVRFDSPEDMRVTLSNLVDQCRAQNLKLVVSCQRATWELYRLAMRLDRNDLFGWGAIGGFEAESGTLAQGFGDGRLFDTNGATPDQVSVESGAEDETAILPGAAAIPTYSFLLQDFSEGELSDALAVRYGNLENGRSFPWVKSPHFAALRNPYLLNLFNDLSERGVLMPGALDRSSFVDGLLDRRVDESLKQIAAELVIDDGEMRAAFDGLVERLWNQRQLGGLSSSEVARCLSESLQLGKERQLIAFLQTDDILTVSSPLRIAQPLLEDRLFARLLGKKLERDPTVLDELNPRRDSGAVIALLRSVAHPAQLAETLLSRSRQWRKAICVGLGQADPVDWSILSLLTVLARPSSTGLIEPEAAEALGQLAGRSRRAREWVARLYLSDRHVEQLIGERALSVTVNVLPRHVAAIVRLRLRRGERLPAKSSSDKSKRDRRLSGALDPFLGVQEPDAAREALRLLKHFGDLTGKGEAGANTRYGAEVDAVRGISALALGGEALEDVWGELQSPDVLVRFRGARSLKSIAIDRPDIASEPVCAAISSESHPDVLNELIWSSHKVSSTSPEKLFKAVASSPAAPLRDAPRTAGTLLTLMSDLASSVPMLVLEILPERIDCFDPKIRAMNSEVFSFAWWRIAEQIQDAKHILDALTRPDIQELPDEYRVFAIRGAVVALLGSMCSEYISSRPLVGWHNPYSNLGRQFYFIWMDEFVCENATFLTSHPKWPALRTLLIDAVEAARQYEFDFRQRPFSNASYLCGNRCLEMLACLVATTPDPLDGLDRLPAGRETLYVARRLLEIGRVDEDVVRFARSTCELYATDSVNSGTDEYGRCVALLEKIAPVQGGEDLNRRSSRSSLGHDNGDAGIIAQLGESDPSAFLYQIDEKVRSVEDLATLYYLVDSAQRWSQYAIAEVYSRMFSVERISHWEVQELIEMLLLALADLPDSSMKTEYVSVYGAIGQCCRGEFAVLPTLDAGDSLIERSHRKAIDTLRKYGLQGKSKPVLLEDTDICSRDGWWVGHFRIDGDTIHYSKESVYMFPAVRLALAAISMHSDESDPGGAWIRLRRECGDFFDRWSLALDTSWDDDDSQYRLNALEAFHERSAEFARDERFLRAYGLLALLLEDFETAERELTRAELLPWGDEFTRASALYNLACVYARTGREQECREALQKRYPISLSESDKTQLRDDTDFESVRHQRWFQELLLSKD